MKSPYKQLTQEQRYHISGLLKVGISKSQIALEIGCNRSTIYRELKRNTGKKGYRPKQAQTLANLRKRDGNTQITNFCWAYVELLIRKYWSPEQINGRLKAKGWLDVISPERIYQYIYLDKVKGGPANQDRRGQIVDRTPISRRDQVTNNRERLGDFEGDTIIGKNHQGAILTLVDRVSKLTKIRPLGSKNAQNLADACVLAFNRWQTHSITFDNGKEFSRHSQISQVLYIDVYFCDPYSSWQRGTNENTNGLIRQFFPKNIRLNDISQEQTKRVEQLLNNRPRKSLEFKIPIEVESRNSFVALTTGI